MKARNLSTTTSTRTRRRNSESGQTIIERLWETLLTRSVTVAMEYRASLINSQEGLPASCNPLTQNHLILVGCCPVGQVVPLMQCYPSYTVTWSCSREIGRVMIFVGLALMMNRDRKSVV